MDIKDAAKLAIDVQDACNLSGVVFSFAKVMQVICDVPGKGTDWRNGHPIAKIFAWKIALLSGVEVDGDFHKPYTLCHNIAAGDTDAY